LSEDTTITAGEYQFTFSKIVGQDELLTYKVKRKDGSKTVQHEIESFLEDMGKWETLRDTSLNILHDIGLMREEDQTKQFYGRDKYKINYDELKLTNIVVGEIILKEQEKNCRPPSEQNVDSLCVEISDQIRNIPKWRDLRKLLAALTA
jgi:hypothetical protein